MNGNAYYGAGVPNSATPYPPLTYADQATAAGPGHQNGASPFDSADGASYLYAAASAATTAASASPNPMDQSANPLVAFASQATRHVAVQSAEDWQPQAATAAQMLGHNHANAWHDWTAAIAAGAGTNNSQERFSANALLTLGGSGRPGEIAVGHGGADHQVGQSDGMGGVGGVNVSHMATAHSGQWPLLLFSPDTPGIGGGSGGGGGGGGSAGGAG